jgi:gliding motility-associated-like protein
MKTTISNNANAIITGLVFTFLVSVIGQTQVIKAFTQRTSSYTPSKVIYNIQGDFTMIGNSNMTLQSYDDNENNSNNVMIYNDIDGDPTTLNSSSSVLGFSTENGAVPECSNIIYAGLYWTGRASNESSSPESFSVTKGGLTKTLNKRKINFKGPGQAGYTEFTANPGNIYYPDGTYGNMYSAYIEVTDYVRNCGVGAYTAADIALIEGNGGATGYYGGWGMIVIYENSKMNWRDVTLFDGHAYVVGNTSVNYELPVSGFQTVQSGDVNMKLGLMAGEGDVGIAGDYFKIRNWQNTSWVTLNHSGNSSNNFFNGSVNTGGNARTPNLQNNTGVDIAMFNIPNVGNTVLANNQTSTRFQYGSTQDTYIIFAMAMSVDAYIPDIEAFVSAESINGIPVGSGPITVLPGEDLEYMVEIKNQGTEAINNAVFIIPIPYTTTFVGGSIVNDVTFLPLPLPNNAYFDPTAGPTGSIVWDFGTLPLIGGFPDSVLARLSFHLTVTDDCNILANPDCPPTVALGGIVSGEGAVSGSDFSLQFIQGYETSGLCVGEPIKDPLIIEIDAASYLATNCSTTPVIRDFVFCNYNLPFLPYDSVAQYFPVGLSFYNTNNVTPSSIKYDENNPFPANVGTQTYFAIPDGISFCYYTFTLTIQEDIVSNAIQSSPETCIGAGDGSINLIVNGGTSPYTFLWTGPGVFTSTSEDLSSLSQGGYSVVVTDDIGCTSSASATVSVTPDLTNPSISCVGNQSENVIIGTCAYTLSGTVWDAIASDNCTLNSVSYSLTGATTGTGTSLNGVNFNIGLTTVTWTATDGLGNTNSCSYSVTVIDNILPAITSCGAAGNQTVNVDAAQCNFTQTGTAWNATATDNCAVSTIVATLSGATTASGLTTLTGVDFNLGTTTVLWTVTDGVGNVSTCTFDVTVIDNILPSITSCGAAGNQTVNVDAAQCNYTQAGNAWNATAIDNCTVSTVIATLSGATTASGLTTLAGVDFNLGTTTVLWTVTDGVGNISTCTFNVTVVDNILPSITSCGAAGNQTVNVDAAQCDYTQTGTAWDATATDNCTVSTIVATLSGATTASGLTTLAGVDFNLGTTTVLWTVTDGVGNISTCTFNVTVVDNILPTITSCGAAGNQTVNVDAAQCNFTQVGTAWDATATDNCTVSTVIATLSGTTTASGLTTLAGVDFNLGTTAVLWTVTDGVGNISTCTFNVTVVDNILPSITSCGAAGNQTVNVDAAQCDYTQTGTAWDATATDNCTVSTIVATLSGATTASGLTTLAGVDFNLGTTTVLWTVTDGVGNISTCTFNVTVVDNILPTITSCGAAGNQTVNVDAAQCNFTQVGTAWDATATDNCTVSTVIATLSGTTTASGLTTLAGVDFNLGTTAVLWTVTDGVGNISTCTFNVTVVDNILPSITSCGAAGNQTVNVDAAQCDYTQTGTAWDATATDNCTVSTIVATLSGATTASGLTTLAGVDFNLGTTTVLWTVTDGVGNISTCTFNVTVVDNILPTITSCGAAGNQTVNVDAAQCNFTQVGTAWDATATDNCTVSTVIATLSGTTTASGLTTLAGVDFNLGTTAVLWTVTDGVGNISTCTFNVTVVDNILPSITSCGVAGNQTVNVDAAQCNFTQTGTAWDATATDNCTVSTILATLSGVTTASGLTTLAGVDFNLGTTTVLWTVTDGVGNTSSCTFDVTVVDNINPTILSCGATGAQVVSSDLGVCTYTQTSNSWDAVASDNCTVGSISYTLSGATTGSGTSLAGVTFNSGVTTVLWTVVDGSLNTSTCTFTVEVEDNQAPIISGCPTNIVVGTDNGDCGAIVTWSVPTFTDNCGAVISSNSNSGDFFATGTSTVVYTVTDGAGNISICSFTVTVNDDELPSLTCPTPISSCDPFVVYPAPTYGDNCGILSTLQTAGLSSGVNFPVGTTVNAYQTTDIHGNISTCSFSVTIFSLPVALTDVTDVSCFGLNDGQIDLTITSGTAPFTYSWSNSQSSEDLIGLAPGTYSVSVTDDNGCSTTASAGISEPELLQLSAEYSHVNCYNGNDGLIDLYISGGTSPYTYTWSNGATSEDLSGLSAGAYDVLVSDFNGCEISYNTTITQPDSLMITATVYDANCGTATGTISVQVTGGNAPYQFAWSNGTTEMSLYNVVTGTYTLIVTDAANCTNSFTGTISTTSSLNATLIAKEAKCFGENSGTIQAVVSSGYAPFTYDWSDGQSSPTAIDLTAGTYSVTITDMFGCQVTLNGTVNQPDSLYAIVTSSVYAGGYNVSSNNGSDGYLNTQVFGGTSPYSFDWTGPSNFTSTNQNLVNLEAGAYALILTDGNGCTFSTSTRLVEPTVLEMPNGYSPNGDGDNETFVVHGIDAYPNNEIVVYNRWGNIVYKKANYANEWAGDNTVGEALPDGTYFVILTVVAGEEEITLKGYVDLRR